MNFIIDNFDKLFNSEESLKKLEEIILDLAIKGKLVPQDPNDEPASVLLEKIKAEKEQLMKEKKVKKDKDLALITEEEIPFAIPESWEWVRLGAISEILLGLSYRPSDVKDSNIGIPVIRSSNISKGKLSLDELVWVDKAIREKLIIKNNDILMCVRSGSEKQLGKCIQFRKVKEKMTFGSFMVVIRTSYNDYLELFFNSSFYKNNLKGISTMTINQITQKNLRNTLVPLPPLSEQRKIVKKVNEFREYISIFRKKLLMKAEIRKGLISSMLNRLENDDFLENKSKYINLLFENFEIIFESKEDIKRIRNFIYTMAVTGKLSKLVPEDTSVNEMIKNIEIRKIQLIREKIIKSDKKILPILDKEIPFNIPNTWQWVRLDSICEYIQSGRRSPIYVKESEIPIVSQKCIQWNGFFLDRAKFIDPNSLYKYDKNRFLKENDLLINSTGLGTLGRVCIFNNDFEYKKIVVDAHVTIIRPILVSSKFLSIYFSESYFQSKIHNESSRVTKQWELSMKLIKNQPIPLPPMEEQERIVNVVEKLNEIVDHLDRLLENEMEEKKKLINIISVI